MGRQKILAKRVVDIPYFSDVRNVTLLFSLFVSLGLQAQSNDWFAPVGATWTYYDYTDGPPWVYHQRPYFQAKVVKDSVIMGKECRKVQRFEADGSLDENSTVWIHVDSNRIYFFEEDTFYVHFDQTLQVGDTLHYTVPSNNMSYNYTCCPYSRIIEWQALVDSIKMVDVGGEALKRWYLSYIETSDSMVMPFSTLGYAYFTEEIGWDPFFGLGDVCCLGGFGGDFHCYEDQTTFINVDTMDCTYPVGNMKLEKETIQITPNPTDGNFEIKLPSSLDFTSVKASIFSMDGRLITHVELQIHNTNLHIDLPSGIYLVQILLGDSQFTQRISVIR